MSRNTDSADDHTVTYLTGGRVGEIYTAQCSCGAHFKSTHNAHLRRAITRHMNKVAADAAKAHTDSH